MSDQYVGEIRMFAGKYAPQGWEFCNGQTLPINQYEVLYTLIGTTYGGDGRNDFKLPDLRGRLPLHNGTSKDSAGNDISTYKLGQTGGAETVTLTDTQLPTHTHIVNAQEAIGTSTSPENTLWATSTSKQYSTLVPNSTMSGSVVSSVGGNQAHSNMMPYLPVSFIIAVVGLFPSQF